MKKITFALAACAALTFAACGNNATEENKIDSTENPNEEPADKGDTTEIDSGASIPEVAPALPE